VTAIDAHADIFRNELERAFDQAELKALRKAMFPRKNERHVGRCGYCGRRSWGRVCAHHRDLVQLEATTT
jgi:hypothetical protein